MAERLEVPIRAAAPADLQAMWALFQAVTAPGDTLPWDDGTDLEAFRRDWFEGTQRAWVATAGGRVVGMYKMGANYPGRGAHVANASYAVSPEAQGRGVGRALVEDSLARAREAGFMALQFNYVVSTNTVAIGLYERLGFKIIGTSPRAFRHRVHGLVDTCAMHRFL